MVRMLRSICLDIFNLSIISFNWDIELNNSLSEFDSLDNIFSNSLNFFI